MLMSWSACVIWKHNCTSAYLTLLDCTVLKTVLSPKTGLKLRQLKKKLLLFLDQVPIIVWSYRVWNQRRF